ncbi:MAG TPA: alpha/beta fold hydrolase [Patescibacteria group bacterium]|nr:alpha/beta fold hydrolase [Patescibacteria group bacterium]
MKQQILVIHGGDTFADTDYDKYIQFLQDIELDYARLTSDKTDWKRNLRRDLGADYEVILPSMPNKFNARFTEWKLWFEKLFPFLRDDIILIGHSMGGAFLAKYLTENQFPKKIKALALVAAPADADSDGNSLHTFELPSQLNLPAGKIYLYYSTNDPIVDFDQHEKYSDQLPQALLRTFEDRGHFNQKQFPEIIEDIKNLV